MGRLVWLIVGAGAALRLAWWAYAQPAPVSDFEYYRRLALDVLTHGQFGYPEPSGYRVPGYPLFLAALMLVTRSTAWLSFGNVVLSSLVPYLVYRLAVELTTIRAALVAAAIAAANPTFVLFSPVLASEHLFTVFLLAAFLVTCRASGRAGTLAVAGLLLGAAILTRPEGLFYLPVFVAAGLSQGPLSRMRMPLLAFLVAAFLVVMPWYLRNEVVLGPGTGLSTSGGLSLYYGHNPTGYWWHPLKGTPLEGLSEAQIHRRGYQLAIAYLRAATPTQLAADLRQATGRFFSTEDYAVIWSTRAPGPNPDTFTATPFGERHPFTTVISWFTVALFAAAASAVVLVRRYPGRTWAVLYGVVAMSWIGYCVVFAASPRYRYATEAILCILAALPVAAALSARGPATIAAIIEPWTRASSSGPTGGSSSL
jgi:4-amino-4-deoxy-L-arabinose transferase-like glycosyltransferase